MMDTNKPCSQPHFAKYGRAVSRQRVRPKLTPFPAAGKLQCLSLVNKPCNCLKHPGIVPMSEAFGLVPQHVGQRVDEQLASLLVITTPYSIMIFSGP